MSAIESEGFEKLEARLGRLEDCVEIQNLRGTFYRFHDDQHVGERRRELYADKHPCVDIEGIKKAREVALVDSLEGNTLIHPLMTPVVEVDEKGRNSRAVFTSLGYEGLSIHCEEPMAIWSTGLIPGAHVKQDGEWRILYGEWQRTIKADMEKGWVKDMQKSNCRPPLSELEDRNYLGKYAYQKDEIRKPVPQPPQKDTYVKFPCDTDKGWIVEDTEKEA